MIGTSWPPSRDFQLPSRQGISSTCSSITKRWLWLIIDRVFEEKTSGGIRETTKDIQTLWPPVLHREELEYLFLFLLPCLLNNYISLHAHFLPRKWKFYIWIKLAKRRCGLQCQKWRCIEHLKTHSRGHYFLIIDWLGVRIDRHNQIMRLFTVSFRLFISLSPKTSPGVREQWNNFFSASTHWRLCVPWRVTPGASWSTATKQISWFCDCKERKLCFSLLL